MAFLPCLETFQSWEFRIALDDKLNSFSLISVEFNPGKLQHLLLLPMLFKLKNLLRNTHINNRSKYF